MPAGTLPSPVRSCRENPARSSGSALRQRAHARGRRAEGCCMVRRRRRRRDRRAKCASFTVERVGTLPRRRTTRAHARAPGRSGRRGCGSIFAESAQGGLLERPAALGALIRNAHSMKCQAACTRLGGSASRRIRRPIAGARCQPSREGWVHAAETGVNCRRISPSRGGEALHPNQGEFHLSGAERLTAHQRAQVPRFCASFMSSVDKLSIVQG